jgi:hypothetical protein
MRWELDSAGGKVNIVSMTNWLGYESKPLQALRVVLTRPHEPVRAYLRYAN